jgi:glutamate N-acetyltransferase/amino-acid N-acetyltransferase
LKKSGAKDLGVLISQTPAAVAGLFTRNRVQAAPVLLCRERVRGGIARAVLVNSGNANCCTGDAGMQTARGTTAVLAAELGVPSEQVLPASTGVIGVPLPADPIEAAVPKLVQKVCPEGLQEFAEAIMTTDTVPKVAGRRGRVGGRNFGITGVAKGAGMIRPDLATMLCFICTDVAAESGALQAVLSATVRRSLNRITIDGDTSTNDTVLALANGLSGVELQQPQTRDVFQRLLGELLDDLARRLISDAEGATKLFEVIVQGAASEDEALQVARTVADSSLVKTAVFGEDANWGRVLAAAGRSGVPLDPRRIDLYFGDVMMVRDGQGCGPEAEAQTTAILRRPAFRLTIDLHMGTETASVLTCDLSLDYVRINADYRS